ncbi:MAG: D-alanine--D-alanine ligase family protein [Dehalococcoidia bacterium]
MARSERLKVGLLFGGRSAEHEVSIVSAQGVLAALDPQRFQALPIGITKQGTWLTPKGTAQALAAIKAERFRSLEEPLGEGILHRVQALSALRRLDVVFPLVHGTMGEDGTLQGFLELAGVPYAGAGVAASALGMDKALQQAIYRQHGLPVPGSLVILAPDWQDSPQASRREIEANIGYPCFIKPANGGSSIGTSKVGSRGELDGALEEALRYDRKALVEVAIEGRQLEVAVLGNDEPQASPLGEVSFGREFYDYVAKYDDPDTRLHIPAEVPPQAAERAREMALAAFRAIDCAGLARVDFFLTPEGDLYLNEINTIPGFTPMSMYPKLWEAAGLPYSDLITRLIELAQERHQADVRRGNPRCV